jgi:error-prone DNA polymerase
VEPGTRYAIRKPFTAVREVSEDDAKLILWERLTNGLFTGVEDFYRRVPLEEDALRSLARSGAFDEFAGDGRKALWEVGLLLRSPVPRGRRMSKELFEIQAFSGEDIPDLPELKIATRLSWDYEMHGSGRMHPMTLMRRTLNELEIRTIETCYRFGRYVPGKGAYEGAGQGASHAAGGGIPGSHGRGPGIPRGTSHDLRGGPAVNGAGRGKPYPTITVAGLSMLRQRPPTAHGVLFITLEDETGFVQCVVRPKVLEHLDHVLRHSSLIVRGELHIQGNWRGLVVTNAWPLNGIFGGYEGHPCQDAGRDRLVVQASESIG